MINEFHSCLLNRPSESGDIPGEDYQDEYFVPAPLDVSAKTVQRQLLTLPTRPESANWRACEIRRLVRACDFIDLAGRFDPRTGFHLDDLTAEMASLLRPRISGGPLASTIKISGRFRLPQYQLTTWLLSVEAESWSIASSDFATIDGDFSGGPVVTVSLPGHGGQITFPSSSLGVFVVRQASTPTVSIAKTSENLRNTTMPAIVTLAENADSIFDTYERGTLRNVATGNGESVAQVCAAALLFAGHVSFHASRTNRDSTATASL